MKAASLFLLAAILLSGLSWSGVERVRHNLEKPADAGSPLISEAGVADSPLEDLGRFLFFDPRLSGDGSMSCASCHHPDKSFTDGLALSTAYPGSDGFRNTKTVLNTVRAQNFYWDGRLSGSDPETQVRDSITETHFMNLDGRLMLERLKQIPEYVEMFSAAFGEGTEPSFGGTLRAIAAFERTLVTGESPFDRGDLSEPAERGLELFNGKARCNSCHNGDDFTDGLAHRTGVPENEELFSDPLRHLTYRSFIKAMGVPGYMYVRRDVGRYTVSKDEADIGAFITPSLRQVEKTAPYMHNGVLPTLRSVLDFYNAGEGDETEPLGLSGQELNDLEAFLRSLTGPEPEIEIPQVPQYQPIDNWLEVRN